MCDVAMSRCDDDVPVTGGGHTHRSVVERLVEVVARCRRCCSLLATIGYRNDDRDDSGDRDGSDGRQPARTTTEREQ